MPTKSKKPVKKVPDGMHMMPNGQLMSNKEMKVKMKKMPPKSQVKRMGFKKY